MVVRRIKKAKAKAKAKKEEQSGLKTFHLHLVSDATGTTLLGLARACLAQFQGIDPVQKFWPLVKTERQLERVIKKKPKKSRR